MTGLQFDTCPNVLDVVQDLHHARLIRCGWLCQRLPRRVKLRYGQRRVWDKDVLVLFFDGGDVCECEFCAHILCKVGAEMCNLVVYILKECKGGPASHFHDCHVI